MTAQSDCCRQLPETVNPLALVELNAAIADGI